MLTLPAPAKLNLMLHITGQREDGYHNLQTLFQFVDYCDQLSFEPLDTPDIQLNTALEGVEAADNLIVRAARSLQLASNGNRGVRINLEKHIPMGGGLGGGSSNAATTLVGLNYLWQSGLSLDELTELGVALGADVPVFIRGHSAWAEGVGEQLTAVSLKEPVYLVITPDCHVDTGKIFSHRQLTRNTTPITIAAALERGGNNDCETLVRELFPAVDQAIKWLKNHADARMTGTGSSVFAPFDSRTAAEAVLQELPRHWQGFVTQGCNQSPLHVRLAQLA